MMSEDRRTTGRAQDSLEGIVNFLTETRPAPAADKQERSLEGITNLRPVDPAPIAPPPKTTQTGNPGDE